jgi:hypothetical protein
MPSRFKKDIVRAASTNSFTSNIHVDGMHRVLVNIGAEDRVSVNDIRALFTEIGDASGSIPRDKLEKLL